MNSAMFMVALGWSTTVALAPTCSPTYADDPRKHTAIDSASSCRRREKALASSGSLAASPAVAPPLCECPDRWAVICCSNRYALMSAGGLNAPEADVGEPTFFVARNSLAVRTRVSDTYGSDSTVSDDSRSPSDSCAL